MSKKMESKPTTPSVIARLMGLDELQSQQLVSNQKKQKGVLSETYLRKVASIGAWEKKRSFDKRSSFRLSNGEDETDMKEKGFIGGGKGISHAQFKERKNLRDGVKSVASRSIRSSETVKESTRKTRDNRNDISLEPPRSGFGGAWGLTNELELMMVSTRNNSDVNNRYKPSYLAREANEKISERWSITKEFRENGLVVGDRGRSRTLGEMLVSPDRAKCGNFLGPSGIRSRDGWKNAGRSEIYSTSFGSPYVTMKPVFPWSRSKSLKQVSSQKGCPKQRNSGFNYKQSQSSPDQESEKSAEQGTVQKMCAEDCVVPEPSVFSAASPSIVSDQVESKGCTMPEKDLDSSVCIPDAWSQQGDVTTKKSTECSIDPDFLVNLETVNQQSPVSVLDAPFTEGNFFSSKCFPSITASLNDVKRQLEFIKSESIEEYSEGPGMFVSSDDENDAREESLKDREVNEYSRKLFAVAAENRDISYLVDVLTEAGFHSMNPDILFNGWNSLETPISLSIFEALEKKYGQQITWKRSERRLLFDLINSGLTKILQPCLGDPMWTKPVAKRLSYSWNSKEIEEELYMFVSQENAKSSSSEKVFGKDDGWLSLGYQIEEIGREIENSLIDELAAEIVSI